MSDELELMEYWKLDTENDEDLEIQTDRVWELSDMTAGDRATALEFDLTNGIIEGVFSNIETLYDFEVDYNNRYLEVYLHSVVKEVVAHAKRVWKRQVKAKREAEKHNLVFTMKAPQEVM